MKTAQAGTVESMDCLVTVSEAEPGKGISLNLAGASVARFSRAMEKAVRETLETLGIRDLTVSVQDNGALDLVLKARVEAAVARLKEGGDQA
ncbi:MAG: citrate lyase acyl carrier protein [Synergistaceae bacterium]|jgi:citrate lyase subunit gamma (acyl carrier protein)|nr:citrate lyase acyl carrier protein [Synergistaceae bacterium]